MCQEEEIAITDPSTAVTVVPVAVTCGVRIASVKEWDSSSGGESNYSNYYIATANFKINNFNKHAFCFNLFV